MVIFNGKNRRIDDVGSEKQKLVIVDDAFPSMKSGFRYMEFTKYLELFNHSLVVSSGESIKTIDTKKELEVFFDYIKKYPCFENRIFFAKKILGFNRFEFAYFIFLNNAFKYISMIEKSGTPFAFTLYPGGGLSLHDPVSDNKLKRILSSPCFKKVIVTQKVVFDYLIDNKLCQEDKVEMIFGVVMPLFNTKNLSDLSKKRWGEGKKTLDICFMAHRYTKFGEDKGYDVFVAVAKKLLGHFNNINFHVVGPYDETVINVDEIENSIKFYGVLNPDKFDTFFQDIDIILSPNISGKITLGSFDGFPTASCVEAALRGVAIFAVDEFNSSEGYFSDGQNIVILEYNIDAIVDKIFEYYKNPVKLKMVGEKGCMQIQKIYGFNSQIQPRVNLLNNLIKSQKMEKKDYKYKVKILKSRVYYYYRSMLIYINKRFGKL